MTKNEEIVRNGYEIAERQDPEGFIATFTSDGQFVNEALGISYHRAEMSRYRS